GNVLDVNPAGCRLNGLRRNQLVGKNIADLIPPDQKEKVSRDFPRLVNGEIDYVEGFSLNGAVSIPVEIRARRIEYFGKPAVLLHVRDVTRRYVAENSLRESEKKYSTLVEGGNDGIVIIQEGLMKFANKKMLLLTGFAKEEVIGQSFDRFIAEPFRQGVLERYKKRLSGEDLSGSYEILLVKKNGGTVPVEINSSVIEFEGRPGLQAVIRDVSERKETEQQLKVLNRELRKANRQLGELAMRDSHTGLYNFRHMEQVLEAEFERSRRSGRPLSLLLLDIDYFKAINDVYGHTFGDLVLKQFSRELEKLVRRYDTVVRFGGEEFVVIAPGAGRDSVLQLAGRILDGMHSSRFGKKKNIVNIKVSIAAASYPEDRYAAAVELLEAADQILNKTKIDGGDRIYSSMDMKKGKILVSAPLNKIKEKLERLLKRGNQNIIEALNAFSRSSRIRDGYPADVSENVTGLLLELSGKRNLPLPEKERLFQAAVLYEIGKLGIDDAVLLKPGPLSTEEFAVIRSHPHFAAELAGFVPGLRETIPVILHHHERWDGKGYPSGLKGKKIPLGARMLSLADSFQALVSSRPYRKAYSEKAALGIIKKESGSKFDPELVNLFLEIRK
ncbi:MAG TPA: diguanylate cyclase, partial [bacterium]|nr:diguanylate cyclase [bacterium]